ncbi:MAG: RNA polymerase sigma factor [Leptospiraceae bacterium]|nr:RNA polymerase sigma factor [Leptospiraceae bacterium]MCP5497894.1 RNA polymerase sigma factor [Leptospiraceae bacterium]
MQTIEEFYKKERTKLVHFVQKWVGDFQDSEDIVQDIIFKILDNPDFDSPIENISAYIYKALRNKITDSFRKRKPELSLDNFTQDKTDKSLLSDNIMQELERRQLSKKLEILLNSLETDQKEVIVATELEGRSFSDLSGEWKIPIGTLLARKHRGLKKLRKQLEEENF